MKIGILGGTFDPPHAGHIALAHSAIETLELDEVMMLPAHRNPLKKGHTTPAKQRMEMLQLAIQDDPKLSLSDIEVSRGGPSYAVDTLSELTYIQQAEYWFILGSDPLKEIDKWKQPQRLLKMCRLAVAVREGQNMDQLLMSVPAYVPEAIDWLPMPPMEISSSEIRRRLGDRKPMGQWLNPDVLKYIEANKLYRT
ncbi:MAG TPA: nicotinate-nucleotide adenylyltransferase [Fimbriimonadaceae bacterium]|jgi:nicotinate-nucleotide adenylyltransferase